MNGALVQENLVDHAWLAGTPWHKHVPARVEAIG